MLIAVHCGLLVALEQLAGTVGELAGQTAVAGFVLQEVLIAAGGSLESRVNFAPSAAGLKRNRFQ